ncbi:MAG TPA: ABC transporter ATP-binding protein [Planctomycetota bacterium]|nr:ABC transporter ATP-binding protein [Planctomycetota bacterium]
MEQPLIRIEKVRRVFHMGEVEVHALREVSLEIKRGELVALTGTSGSGKTTLMNLLGCLDRPSAGEYWLNGEPTAHLSARERAVMRNRLIGFVFQSFNLLPRTTAVDQVRMPLAYTASQLSSREGYERAVKQLGLVGLADRLDHTPAQMSGGQQQRVAIARALVNRPPLLLADEPTGNLDSRTTLEVLALLQTLNRDEGITVIIVTHDPTVAAHTGRNIRLSDGQVVFDKRIEPILANPSAPVPSQEVQP